MHPGGERVPRLRVVLGGGGGVHEQAPTKSKLGRQGSRHRPSFTKALEIGVPDTELHLRKIKDRTTDSRYNSLGKVLGIGPGHNPQMKPRPPGGDSRPDAIPTPPCLRGSLSTTTR